MSLVGVDQIEHTNQGLFTCLSCSIAFHSADDQSKFHRRFIELVQLMCILLGEHYRSDHHRYNMKRRVAGLPPVSADVFNQKVLDRRAETAIMASPKDSFCAACG